MLGLGLLLASGPAPTLASPPSTTGDAGATATVDVASLQADLDAILDDPFFQGIEVTVVAIDLETGQEIYARNPDLAVNPASNTKLLTTAAALALLGPEHRYETSIWADRLDGDTVEGDLYLVGGGDPALVTGDLYELAASLRAAGIRKVTGGVVVDASRFDQDGLPPGFDQKDEFASYRAPIGAAAINFDTFEVRVKPGDKVGDRPRVAIVPPVPSIEIKNEASTVDGSRNRIAVGVHPDGNGNATVRLVGGIGTKSSGGDYRYPVQDPSRYAGEALVLVLEQAGIEVGKDEPSTGTRPKRARRLARHHSDTLSVLCRSVNKLSNNFMAEQILRTLAEGDGASADASLERVRGFASSIGLPEQGLRYGNGSGLYDNNRLSARQIARLLAHVHGDFRIRADYLASLAIMGVDGTTRRRLSTSPAKGWIRAKTGTLDGVSALSGYVGSEDRDPIAFSILVSGFDRWRVNHAREAQNAIAERLARAVVQGEG